MASLSAEIKKSILERATVDGPAICGQLRQAACGQPRVGHLWTTPLDKPGRLPADNPEWAAHGQLARAAGTAPARTYVPTQSGGIEDLGEPEGVGEVAVVREPLGQQGAPELFG